MILLAVTVEQSLSLLGRIPLKLRDRGWKVVVVSDCGLARTDPWGGRVEIVDLAMTREPSVLRDLKSFVRWMTILAKVKPSVVAIGTPKASFLGLLSAKLVGVPRRVYVLRGLRLETMGGFPRLLAHFVEKVTSQSATEILAVSKSLETTYANLKLAKSTKLSVIGAGSSHGVDTAHFKPLSVNQKRHAKVALGVDPDQTVIGFVGRLSKDKGSDVLAEVVKKLESEGHDFHFLLAGENEGSQNDMSLIKAACRQFTHLGAVPDTAPVFQAMDILLLPTKREGFPNVILEAAACGVPSITTQATGAVDAVVHGETGMVAPLGSNEIFTNNVIELLNDKVLAKKLGDAARVWVETHFDQEIVEKAISAYLSRKRTAEPQ